MKPEESNKQPPEYEFSELKTSVQKVAEPSIAYGKQRYSYADYLSWTDDKMREIIDGIVYAFSAPFLKHARATANFFGKTWAYINRRKGKYDEGTTYEVIYGRTKVPVQTLAGLVIDLEELFED